MPSMTKKNCCCRITNRLLSNFRHGSCQIMGSNSVVSISSRTRPTFQQSFSDIRPLFPKKRQYHLKKNTLQLGVKHRRGALSFGHTLHASYIWRTIKFIINGKCTFSYQNSLPYILSILAIF